MYSVSLSLCLLAGALTLASAVAVWYGSGEVWGDDLRVSTACFLCAAVLTAAQRLKLIELIDTEDLERRVVMRLPFKARICLWIGGNLLFWFLLYLRASGLDLRLMGRLDAGAPVILAGRSWGRLELAFWVLVLSALAVLAFDLVLIMREHGRARSAGKT